MNDRRSSLGGILALLFGLGVAGCVGATPTGPAGSPGTTTTSPTAIAPTSSPTTPSGPPVDATNYPPTTAPSLEGTVTGHITAGPTCPVEAVPPAPGCSPVPVADATVVATDSAGHEVARAVSSADGAYALDLAPGTYTLTPVPNAPMLRAPSGRSVTVPSSGRLVVNFVLDTGIR